MWPCKRVDLAWSDWRFALRRCLAPPDWRQAAEAVERAWGSERGVLACLNVRSAFDLYLGARRWAPGDEIVFSGADGAGHACHRTEARPAGGARGRRPRHRRLAAGRPRTGIRPQDARRGADASFRGPARRRAGRGPCPGARHRDRRGLRPGVCGPRVARPSGLRPRALLVWLHEDGDRPGRGGRACPGPGDVRADAPLSRVPAPCSPRRRSCGACWSRERSRAPATRGSTACWQQSWMRPGWTTSAGRTG